MRVLMIGSGGREHALCTKIAQSPLCKKLFCAPGNAGITAVAECVALNTDKNDDVLAFCQKEKIDFVMIGPEAPLVAGLADTLRAQNILVFGPDAAAAALEGSKGFMKDVAAQAGVATAAYKRCRSLEEALAYIKEQGAPIVVKTDGLAAGKGVTLAMTLQEAEQAVRDAMENNKFGESGAELVIEEFMTGPEISFFALCDGERAIPFASAQDHKAAYDGDKGPNTGGMGAYSPAPIFTPELERETMEHIIQPVMDTMRAMGKPYKGVLFAGLMLTPKGLRLLEFNVRFGDPETQAMVMRVESDLLAALIAAANGTLDKVDLCFSSNTALCVVMAAEGYPEAYKKNTIINGLGDAAQCGNVFVFHAGTSLNNEGLVIATGGRVLGITGMGKTVQEAQKAAYAAVDCIEWPEGFCRRDIGWRALKHDAA